MRKKGLTPRIILLVIASDIIEFFIMVSFKKVSEGMPTTSLERLGLTEMINLICLVAHAPFFWLGFLGMLLSFIIWTSVLSALDLSVAFPLGSMSFVLIPILSIIFMGEEISALRWLGILVITCGIAWLSVKEKPVKVVII